MNLHAHAAGDQRVRILEAARQCFVRSGFHKATMQDVAAEAGMSAGNIYRYFKSKDDIVAALCEIDRARIAQSFECLAEAEDPLAAFIAVGEQHLVNETRESAIFALDLWAEASRTPRIAQICRDFDADIRRWITHFLNRLIAEGHASPDLDTSPLVDLLICMGDGMLSRRARDPSFDATPHIAQIGEMVKLACEGRMLSMLKTPNHLGAVA